MLHGDPYRALLQNTDTAFETEIKKYYHTFCSITYLIMKSNKFGGIFSCYYNNTPKHYEMINRYLEYKSKSNTIRFQHIQFPGWYYPLMCFQFILKTHIIHYHNFSNFSIIGVATAYINGWLVLVGGYSTLFLF